MSLSQQLKIVPPVESDPKLVDFSSILQRNLTTLFQAGHVHLGVNGVLTSAPTSAQGAIGDIIIGVVSGVAYLYIKSDSTTWWRSPGFTQI